MEGRISTMTFIFYLFILATLIAPSLAITDHGDENEETRRHLFLRNNGPAKYQIPETVELKEAKPKYFRSLRNVKYAAFGASMTWGSGITGDRDKLTYVKLLNPQSSNFAIRASGPIYPSACTQTIMGDARYDVIILEFFEEVRKGLRTLARRLRERFPDAVIVILREWYPLTITNQDGTSLRDWARAKGFGRFSAHDPKMHRAFLESEDTWSWPTHRTEERIEIQEKVAQEFGAHISIMDKPDNPRDWVQYYKLFAFDFLHKSNAGHEELAMRVKEQVRTIGVLTDPRIVDWPTHDACHTWFESGDITGIRTTNDVKLNMFADYGGAKYALEVHKGKPGHIVVNNPSQKWMKLYAAFMITSPAPSKYPKTQVTMLFRDAPPVVLEQEGKNFWGDNFVHIHKMVKIGAVPPGYTTLVFEALEETEWPFRAVSIAITDEVLSEMPGQAIAKRKSAVPHQYL